MKIQRDPNSNADIASLTQRFGPVPLLFAQKLLHPAQVVAKFWNRFSLQLN